MKNIWNKIIAQESCPYRISRFYNSAQIKHIKKFKMKPQAPTKLKMYFLR